MSINTNSNQRGFALLIVVICLSTLSILAVVLLKISIIERATAQNSFLEAQARFNAHSGLDRSIALLQENTAPFTEFVPSENKNDWLFKDNDQDLPPFDSVNNDNNQVGAGRNLDNAHNLAPDNIRSTPSFAARNGDGSLQDFRGYYFSGTIDQDNLNYALKIIDTSSQIHLNAPKFKLIHMLTTLFIEFFGGVPTNASSWQEMAERLLSHRETFVNQKFTQKQQISGDNRLTELEYEQIKDFVSVQTWENPSTFAAPDSSFYNANKPNYVEIANQDISGYTIEPRSPININTAPYVVLVAVLADLKGIQRVFSIPGSDPYKKLNTVKQEVTLSLSLAQQIATEIIVHRKNNPFKLWPKQCPVALEDFSFGKFIDDLVIVGLTQEQKDLVKANANPNAMTNRFMPNQERYLVVDKSDLFQPSVSDPINGATTEFCFTPTGIFEITSIGRVFHPTQNQILAESKLETIVQIFNPVTHTTQKDFFNAPVQTDIDLFPETIYHCSNSSLLNSNSDEMVQNGSIIDGYVQLKNTVEFPTSRIFKVFFEHSNFNDLWHAKVGASDIAAVIQQKMPIEDANSVNPEKARSIFKGEFRTPEGSLCYNYGTTTAENPTANGQMISFLNDDLTIDPKEGTISLWVKFDNIENGAEESILHLSHKVDILGPIVRGVEMSVTRYFNQTTGKNELRISRWVWESPLNILSLVNFANSDTPSKLWTRIIIPDIDVSRQNKKWYRLVVGWEDYTELHAVFTHDGTNTNTDALFHFSETLLNIIPNNGLLTLHLSRSASSNLDGNGNDITSISSYLALGGYSFTPQLTLSLFNAIDIIFTIGVPVFRFANVVINRVEGFSSCLIASDGSDFYETPYVSAAIANPGGIFEQNIILDCGCGGICNTPLDIDFAQFTIWNNDLSGCEINSQNISPTTGLVANTVSGQCGDNFPYTVFLTSPDGETSPIFDDITIFNILAYPRFIQVGRN